MSNRSHLPGKFVWFEHVSKDAKKAQAFYAEVFGWRVKAFPMGSFSYDMICTGDTLDTMIGGYVTPKGDGPAHWHSYVSVEDVDAATKVAAANGAKIIDPPQDIPGVGRSAHIADPQGAEISLFKNTESDPPDADATQGQFFWNELHTSDAAKAIAFYEKVVGYTHETRSAEKTGDYHILSRGGVGRGGISGHLAPGASPHWIPYVFVDDPDKTVALAKKLGAAIRMGAEDIPGIGRFGVFLDPTGAALAIMKPAPRQK
jgi:predicted enzyme related to lactoylglutathione lyase